MKKPFRNWKDVAPEARRNGRVIHMGRVFGIMVEKSHELDEKIPTANLNTVLFSKGTMFVLKTLKPLCFRSLGRLLLRWSRVRTLIVMAASRDTTLSRRMPSRPMFRPTSRAPRLGLPSRKRPGLLPGGIIPKGPCMVPPDLKVSGLPNMTDLFVDL